MVGGADVRAIVQNLAAWLISLAIAAVAIVLWPSLESLGSAQELKIRLSTGQIVVGLITCVLVALFAGIAFYNALGRARTYTNRERVMQTNVELVRRFCDDIQHEFLSTRITGWDLSEDSKARRDFRALITEKVHAGYLVKRLWHVCTMDDLTRLEKYLHEYGSRDNYNLRILIESSIAVPEIICIGLRAASFGFPELRSPRHMSLAIHFRRKLEVEAVRKYFDLLWETAIPVKTGPKIHAQALVAARATLSTRPATPQTPPASGLSAG